MQSKAPNQPTAIDVLSRMLNVGPRAAEMVVKVVETLARDIIEGRLMPAADLNSVELAKRFSSSRSPIREALLLLEREGLVSIQARRRPRVAIVDFDRAEEVYRLRAELYAMVARLVADRWDEAALTILREDLASMSAAASRSDVTAYFWATVSFHDHAGDIARDLTLKKLLNSLGLQVLRLRHYAMTLPGRMDASLDDHNRLFRAFRERDSALAGALAHSMVTRAFRSLNRADEIFTVPPGSEKSGCGEGRLKRSLRQSCP